MRSLILIILIIAAAMVAISGCVSEKSTSLYTNTANHSDWAGVILSENSTQLESDIGWQEGDNVTINITNIRTGQSHAYTASPDPME